MTGALILLAILWPLFLIIAVMVALDGGPVFYGHRRIGKDGRAFDCLKFRTMIPGAEECLGEYLSYHPLANTEWRASQKLVRDPRVTPIGALLREWSLDELPQLLNVLRGEMSLVGPRPVTRSEMIHYGPTAALYMSVLPGMTGLWQVSGRSDLSYTSRVALDRTYVERWSLVRDLAILLSTPRAVLRRSGAK
ncbi:sugar transferase [Methylobacterium sp. 77]|uniref:sugar transferase n=1 Tax=Methylobacterium sp. 77 TaxID=1101192 RepID=UPI001FD8F895|nr:sugar transferase [Methylobacterium sp. 77]